jgi:hypothetical protein
LFSSVLIGSNCARRTERSSPDRLKLVSNSDVNNPAAALPSASTPNCWPRWAVRATLRWLLDSAVVPSALQAVLARLSAGRR